MKCVDCGKGALMTGQMGSVVFYACPHCGAKFSKEPGDFENQHGDVDAFEPFEYIDDGDGQFDAQRYETDDAGNQIYIGGEPPDDTTSQTDS